MKIISFKNQQINVVNLNKWFPLRGIVTKTVHTYGKGGPGCRRQHPQPPPLFPMKQWPGRGSQCLFQYL